MQHSDEQWQIPMPPLAGSTRCMHGKHVHSMHTSSGACDAWHCGAERQGSPCRTTGGGGRGRRAPGAGTGPPWTSPQPAPAPSRRQFCLRDRPAPSPSSLWPPNQLLHISATLSVAVLRQHRTAANERCPARVCPRRAVEELGQGGEGGAPPVLGPVTTTTAACGGTRRSTGHGALQDVPPQSPRPPPPPLLELPLLALLGGRGGAVAAAAAARARTGSMKLDSKSASSATASLGSGARLFCEPQPQPMPHSTPSTLSAQCRRHEGAEYPDTQYSSGNERPQGSAQRSTGRSSRDNSVRRSDHAAHEGALLGAGPPGHL